MPRDEDQLCQTVQFCKQAEIRYYLLGNGSNILFADEGFRGAVIDVSAEAAGMGLSIYQNADGDYISANGFEGTVEDIFICNTKVRTNDNKVIYLPNGKLSTSEIVNYTENNTRRVDLTYSISYSDDFDKAAGIVKKVAAENPKVLSDPAPMARITKHSASSIDLFCPVWCKTEDYWTVLFDMNEQVKKAFDENGITIPFDQMDIHVKND